MDASIGIRVMDACPICQCTLDASIVQCPYCRRFMHRECLIDSIAIYDYKRVICPLCKEPLSYTTISSINLTSKQIEKILQIKSERCIDGYIRMKSELINRFKLIETLLNKYPEAINVLLTYRELEELVTEYEQYRAWSEYDSRSISVVEESNQPIERFDKRIRLLRLTSDEGRDDSELFTTLIHAAMNERFVFETNFILHDSNAKMLNQMMDAIASTASFKEITLFSLQELLIVKNEDDKSRITVLLLLERLFQRHPLKTIGRCAFCRGVIRMSTSHDTNGMSCFCDVCFAQYCPHCWRPKHEGSCDTDEIASVIELEQRTRACPNCGLRIERVQGTCEHMFCSDCFVGFNWNDASFITTNFANPHRDKWIESLGEKKADYIDAIEIHSDELKHALDDTRLINFYQETKFASILDFIRLSKEHSSRYISSLEKKLIVKLILENSKRAKYYQRVYLVSIETSRILNRFSDRLLSMLITNMETEHPSHENPRLLRFIHDMMHEFIDELASLFSLADNNITLSTILNRNKETIDVLKTFVSNIDISDRITTNEHADIGEQRTLLSMSSTRCGIAFRPMLASIL